MKVLVVGGTGTIGRAVVAELSKRHEVVVAGHTQGDLHVDITDPDSIDALYRAAGAIDAVIATTGKVYFGGLLKMGESQYRIGLDDKLMGQVNLVLIGLKHVNEGGSFTLTSGVLNQDPIRHGSSAAMVNGALEGFVKSAAIEMPKGMRINVVSPTVLQESLSEYGPYFCGFEAVPAARVAMAFSKSAEGAQTGQVYRVL